jgi:putative oxidoreductase
MSVIQIIMRTDAPAVTVLIRLLVGVVFLSEGVQKFLFSVELGVGRFAKIGIPAPEFTAPMVGTFEIICGIMVIAGLLTRLAAVPLIVIMMTAICATKVPLLLQRGFWAMAHEARTDWAMLLGSIFLLVMGAGRWSIDSYLGSSPAGWHDSA